MYNKLNKNFPFVFKTELKDLISYATKAVTQFKVRYCDMFMF